MSHASYQRIAAFSTKPEPCKDPWWTKPEVQQSRELFYAEVKKRELAMRRRGATAYVDRLAEKR